MPSVSPILPGPVIAPHWRRDNVALSHGMRVSVSSKVETHDHSFILRIGRLSGWARAQGNASEFIGGSESSLGNVKPVGFLVGGIRDGNEDEVAIAINIARTAANARNKYWRISQKYFCIDFPKFEVLVLPALISNKFGLVISEFDLSIRTWALAFGSRACITSATFIIPSHNSHGSQALPPIPLPSIISEKIWPTRDVKQSFSRSSVGSRTAKTPLIINCLYAASLFDWLLIVSGSSSSGTGDNGAKGQSEWYTCRGFTEIGSGCRG